MAFIITLFFCALFQLFTHFIINRIHGALDMKCLMRQSFHIDTSDTRFQKFCESSFFSQPFTRPRYRVFPFEQHYPPIFENALPFPSDRLSFVHDIEPSSCATRTFAACKQPDLEYTWALSGD